MEYQTDTTKPITNQLYMNTALLIGKIDGICEAYEQRYISAEKALGDIRTAVNLYDRARIVLTKTKSDYPAKD